MYNRLQIDQSISFTCKPCIDSTLLFADFEDFNENFDIRDNDFVIPETMKPEISTILDIAHLNINSLRSKIDFLKIFLLQKKFVVTDKTKHFMVEVQ